MFTIIVGIFTFLNSIVINPSQWLSYVCHVSGLVSPVYLAAKRNADWHETTKDGLLMSVDHL